MQPANKQRLNGDIRNMGRAKHQSRVELKNSLSERRASGQTVKGGGPVIIEEESSSAGSGMVVFLSCVRACRDGRAAAGALPAR